MFDPEQNMFDLKQNMFGAQRNVSHLEAGRVASRSRT